MEQKRKCSLAASYPGMGWTDHLPDYLMSRVAEHGNRRASEMGEVALTLQHVGIEPLMTLAAAQRQQNLVREMARQRLTYKSGERFSWRSFSDALAGASLRSVRQVNRVATRGGRRGV